MKSLLRPPCLVTFGAFVTVGLLPTTYSVLEGSLLRYGQLRLAIFILIQYPTPGTRVVGVLSAVAVGVGICLLWGKAPRSPRSKAITLVGLAVGAALVMVGAGIAVRSMTLEYHPNEAAVRWFVSVGAVSLVAGTIAALVRRAAGAR